MTKFRCMPIAIGIPIVFCCIAVFWIFLPMLPDIRFLDFQGNIDPHNGRGLCAVLVAFSLLGAVLTLRNALWRVELMEHKLVCKGLIPKDTFEIFYDSCNIGMDYHIQNGNKIWWIYICSGTLSDYKDKKYPGGMNQVKIRAGFVKILYSQQVYEALLDSLPKKQRTGLITARRCAGFEKQGSVFR